VTRPAASDVVFRAQRALGEAAQLHARLRDGDLEPLAAAARAIGESLARGGQVLVFGNGGSAAEAQHFAGELVGRFLRDRRALAAVALTTDTSVLTAIGNDLGFERVFARQVEALGRQGDVALGISTTGASPNVVEALRAAKARGLTAVALTGHDGGLLGQDADIHVNVPDVATPRVQEAQLTLLHILCDLVEQDAIARRS
jgi:D-sedoheptulose 7-phosphate isomerase